MHPILNKLQLLPINPGTWHGTQSYISKESIEVHTPIDGSHLASVQLTSKEEYNAMLDRCVLVQKEWMAKTAPERGEIVRQFGDALRQHKNELGSLVSLEMGKSLQEGKGEVQEMIDICDFAVGLSRQLYGLTMHSERPQHRMFEQWHPLGIVGIISAFNFPVAVWAWNSALAWVCGNITVWKPSEKTPLTAIACQKIFNQVAKANQLPDGISNVIVGDAELGQTMCSDHRVNLISATGSTRMGRSVAQEVSKRFGKLILELGGNNALIVTEHADIQNAIIATTFGAIGTCGQRCTSTRRLLLHDKIYNDFITRLKKAYASIKIGDPLDENNHVGPLIDELAVEQYLDTLKKLEKIGAKPIIEGGVHRMENNPSKCYVKPCVYEVPSNHEITHTEVFAPILYVMKFKDIKEAISIQNAVPQGLSSAIFSNNIRETEYFLSHFGSDCGIANVNIGTSGAEIGGAFGGEKETGGGRESGSEAWKAYMRRQTNTINYSDKLPLAQGINFNI
ncbi:MAG: aldehyde dehydrogenase family protein [Luteibaculum sp.]